MKRGAAPALRLDANDLRAAGPAKLRQVILTLRKMPTAAPAVVQSVGRRHPKDFIRDVLGAKPTAAALAAGYTDPWTPDQGLALDSLYENRRTALPAGHGPGKTRLFAWAVLWFLYSHEGAIVITTAPTWRQVRKVLWAEIHALVAGSKTPLPGKHNDLEIRLAEKWFAIGVSTRPGKGDLTATAFAGFHAPRVLVVLDEATGVAEEIWEGGEGLTIGPDDRWLVGGNPTDPNSRFKRETDATRDGGLPKWKVIRMDSRNHPNVIHRNPRIVPGAVTWEWIQDRLADYGSEDSPLFRCKVAGLWPDQAKDALIETGWISAAQARWDEIEDLVERGLWKDDGRGCAIGLDVAGEGEDLTVLHVIEQGKLFIPVLTVKQPDGTFKTGPAWHVGKDVMEAVALLEAALKAYPNTRTVAIDDTGLGAGVTARVRQLQREGKLPKYRLAGKSDLARGRDAWIIGVNFGASANDSVKYSDMKSELWWTMRETLRERRVLALPPDDVVAGYRLPKGNDPYAQLTRAIYEFPKGKIIVYDKRLRGVAVEKTKNLPSDSPDVAHSKLLAVYAWRKARAEKVAEPVTSTQQLFDQKTRELIDKSSRKPNRSRRGLSPYQRRR